MILDNVFPFADLSSVRASSANFSLAAPIYLDYNRLNTVCSFKGPDLFPSNPCVSCSLDGSATCVSSLDMIHRCDGGCGDFTVITDSVGSNWTVSVVLQGCDQVQLRCGNMKSDGRVELSDPLTLSVLPSKLKTAVWLCHSV